MKQFARLAIIAILFSALGLSTSAAARNDVDPIFYQFYTVSNCSAHASGIGKVTATYLYYWDFMAQENRVADIMHVSYDLKPGYFGTVNQGRKSVSIKIIGSPGALFASKRCNV